MTEKASWIRLATSPKVVRRALKMAIVVGTILALINHGEALYHGTVSVDRISKIVLTYCVPYLVSTFSSVSVLRDLNREQSQT